MADILDDNDGSVAVAGAAIARLLEPPGEAEPAPDSTATGADERPRGPDGKFVKRQDEAVTEEAPATEPPAVSEEPSAEEESDGEEVRPEAEAEKGPVTKVKVKVDGIEQELPLDEVTKGYSRTADYTRKTQALAEERKRFEAEELAPTREERKLYAERIAVVEDLIQALLPSQEPDWHALRQQADPETFQKMWTEWDANKKRLDGVRQERARVAERESADAQRLLARRLADEHEKLKAAMPDFGDAEKGKQLRDDLIAYAKSSKYNFTDDDLAGVTDHRVLVLLDKARRWDEAQLNKPKIDAKIDRVLETVKPSGAKSKPKMSEIERAKTRLKESGRVEDAAALINRML